MNNRIKRIILVVLICVFAVECIYLIKTNNEIDDLNEKLKSESMHKSEDNTKPIEPPVAPMITINSEINQTLDVYSYKNSIVDRSVGVAHGIVNGLIADGVYLSDVTVSQVRFVDTATVGKSDSVDMFNVEVLITDADGKKTADDSGYLIFYNRWDDDGKGCYFVSTLTKNEIEEKYKDVSNEYGGNVYKAACVRECFEYLKRCQLISEDSLEMSAYAKALAFSKTVDVESVVSDKYTVSVEGNTKSFYYDTDKENIIITVVYTYFEDLEKWAFLYATT